MRLYPCYQKFFAELNGDEVILTPNQRLSRFVIQQYDLYQNLQQKSAWPALVCVSWSQWLRGQAERLPQLGLVLSEQQEQSLWQEVIAQFDELDAVAGAMVEFARSAYERLRLWGLPIEQSLDDSKESQFLAQLIQAYENELAQLQARDSVGVMQAYAEALNSRAVIRPKLIITLGFDDTPPLFNQILEALQDQGTEIRVKNLHMPSAVQVHRFGDQQQELLQAVSWAKAKIEHSLVRQQPIRVALVIPNLAQIRPGVERMLIREFEPKYLYPDEPQHAPPYTISAGQPLAQTPLVSAALTLLRFCFTSISAQQFAELLLSPFLWSDTPLEVRVKLNNKLKETYTELNLQSWAAFLAGFTDDEKIAALYQRVHELKHLVKSTSAHTHQEWMVAFKNLLAQSGWPGSRQLDTLEYQQYMHFLEVCEQYLKLDQLDLACEQNNALQRLQRACYTPFLAQTLTSPLQILGVLEASGLHFDGLWVMGLTDNAWPQPCQPNPLLPLPLQKQHAMPRASNERESELAQRITERFAHSAAEVIFSAPQWQGDEPLRASALLTNYSAQVFTSATSEAAVSEASPSTALEIVQDDYGFALAAPERSVRGGSSVLKDQATCPFRAYARHRLQAENPEPKQLGVTPLLRGNLIHGALERLWAQLQTQQALLTLDEAALTTLINRSLETTWHELNRGELGERSRVLELERCARLIRAWLECEKQRADFTVIWQEKTVRGQVGPLQLNMRLDRLDRLANGATAVVDYKTGKTDTKQWLGARPDEPQVPLYSVLQPQAQACAFAELSIQEVAAKGVVAESPLWPGLKMPEELLKVDGFSSWQELLAYWQQNLAALAQEFCDGKASVAPKNGVQTCRFCDLQSVCRIAQQHQLEGDADDAL